MCKLFTRHRHCNDIIIDINMKFVFQNDKRMGYENWKSIGYRTEKNFDSGKV